MTMNSTSLTAEDADVAVKTFEPLLRYNLEDILQCDNPTRRKLASDFGIVGMDYIPDDEPLGGKACHC